MTLDLKPRKPVTVKLEETNYFVVTINQTEADGEEIKRRLDYINQAIAAGFHISSEHVFQHKDEVYHQVSLVRYPVKPEWVEIPYNPKSPEQIMREREVIKQHATKHHNES
jgi:predicted DNA-binding transcriptional regulator